MSDVTCPYCRDEQEINHDDGYGYEEDKEHEQDCHSNLNYTKKRRGILSECNDLLYLRGLEMKYEKKEGGLALISKNRGIVGWVLKTVNGKFTYDVSRKEKKTHREIFDTEDEAKAGLERQI